MTVGLYLLLVVSWYEPQANDPRTPKLSTLIRREARGRALMTAASRRAMAVVIGVLFSTMLLTNGAAYSIDSARSKLGADIIVIPQQALLSSRPQGVTETVSDVLELTVLAVAVMARVDVILATVRVGKGPLLGKFRRAG